jgi:F-type H+-transporting ATPase subunit k
MGVLGTMFGGVFLLSGGSSKAVQQSPPIKASSRGEEDFIQYVPKTTRASYNSAQKKDETWD